MIVFIIVAAVAIPAIVGPVLSLLKESTKPEKSVTSNFLAQQKLEEITKDDYPSISTTSGFTVYSVVDATDFPNYQWCWNIEYVDSSLATPDPLEDKGYKKITVKVKDPDNTELIYSTMATKRKNDDPAE